jgi:hypothetical protein
MYNYFNIIIILYIHFKKKQGFPNNSGLSGSLIGSSSNPILEFQEVENK